MKNRIISRYLPVSIVIILFSAPQISLAQTDQFRIDYIVEVTSVEDQLFHVTADVKNIRQPAIDLSLPTWTPGWYTVENYAKNILRFRITDANGKTLPHSMTRKQTWRIDSKGVDRIKVEFDYRADILALNQAKITKDLAFFTGIQLFLMAEGHRLSPSTVKLIVPSGWAINSALKSESEPNIFSAPDYDTLVDAPTIAGSFDQARFEVEGKPHYFIGYPAGAFSKEKTGLFTDMLAKIAKAESAIFGGLPYDKYVYFYFFARPESNAGGALEHLNSHVLFGAPGQFATPRMMAGTAAHEFFHLWNVKRIRPVEMWPYDYSRENESPLLWVSEGFTNYYDNLALLRSGLQTREQFLESVVSAITGVESNEARTYISPADASTSTWLGYDTPVAFGISYYTQGQNLGALLDLSILHDTAGVARLDDVMRALFREFYQKGKGFSTEDLISVINRITKRDYHDFFRRYIRGVEVPNYSMILGYAGYQAEKTVQRVPVVGLDVGVTSNGDIQVTRVKPGSPAAAAGLERGDLLKTIDGVEVRRGLRGVSLEEKIGQPLKLVINRANHDKQVDLKVDGREAVSYRIVERGLVTPDQLRIREAWLKAD
jgi:predicted metalloprotease with PDZ domain